MMPFYRKTKARKSPLSWAFFALQKGIIVQGSRHEKRSESEETYGSEVLVEGRVVVLGLGDGLPDVVLVIVDVDVGVEVRRLARREAPRPLRRTQVAGLQNELSLVASRFHDQCLLFSCFISCGCEGTF